MATVRDHELPTKQQLRKFGNALQNVENRKMVLDEAATAKNRADLNDSYKEAREDAKSYAELLVFKGCIDVDDEEELYLATELQKTYCFTGAVGIKASDEKLKRTAISNGFRVCERPN